MKRLECVTLKILSDLALLNAKKEVNSACIFIGYQSKVPEKLKKKKSEVKI